MPPNTSSPPSQHPAAFARRVRGALATISDCSAQTARVDDINLSSRSGAAACQQFATRTPPTSDGIELLVSGRCSSCQLAAARNAARFDGIHLSSVGGAAAVSMSRAKHRPHLMALTCREWAVPEPGSMPPYIKPPTLRAFGCHRWAARQLSAFAARSAARISWHSLVVSGRCQYLAAWRRKQHRPL